MVSSEVGRLENWKVGRLASVDEPSSLPAFQETRKACSISQTVVTTLRHAPFQGRVLSSFPTACNLADEAGRVVSLVTTEVGDGPLNVVVDRGDPFAGIEAGTVARIDRDRAIVSDGLAVDLTEAVAWSPVVTWGESTAVAMATLWDCVQERATSESLLTFWVPAIRSLGGVRMAFQEMARDTAERLLLALCQGDRASITAYATVLAGLGPGATPAGDDFLVGLMADLRA